MFDVNATFIAELLGFSMLLSIIHKYLLPSVSNTLNTRRTYIKEQLQRLKNAEQVMLEAKSNSLTVIQEAEEEAKRIINLAELGSKEIRKKTLEELEFELAALQLKLTNAAENTIKQERLQLKEEVKRKSRVLAEQILRRSVNLEHHAALVEEMVERL